MKRTFLSCLLLVCLLASLAVPAWGAEEGLPVSAERWGEGTLNILSPVSPEGKLTRVMLAVALCQYRCIAPGEKKEETAMEKITLTFNGHTYSATLADNPSARAFADLLRKGPLTVSTQEYGGFEKVGPLGTSLPRSDERITTTAGDIILYQGDQITVYYASNTWNFTRLGRIDDPSGLREALGSGGVEITFALGK